MKKQILVFIFGLCSTFAMAQEKPTYRIEGDQLVRVETKEKAIDQKTGLSVNISGQDYPVYISKNGAYYVVRISKKSGKEYKQYLKLENDDI